jgi:transcriptional regulator with XRE-family HTH domain
MLRLTYERIRRDLSQKTVGTVVRLPQSAVSLIETGRLNPTRRELQRFAEVYDVPPEKLLERVAILESER